MGLNSSIYLCSLVGRQLSISKSASSYILFNFSTPWFGLVWFAYESVNTLKRKAAQTAGLTSLRFSFFWNLGPLTFCLSGTVVFVFPALSKWEGTLPSNTWLLSTFSTSLSLLLMNWEVVGGKQCGMSGTSQSVSLFLQDLGHSSPTLGLLFFLSF